MRRLTSMSAIFFLINLQGCERWELDKKMEYLCKKDGGIKIYENVILAASEFNNMGQPLAKYEKNAKSIEDSLGLDYRYLIQKDFIVGEKANIYNGRGRLIKIYEAVYRRNDNKLLGEYIWYSRVGGDMITFGFQPSGNTCPKPGLSLINMIFVKEK